MYTVSRSALVSHSAEKMFNLVNDVDRYSDFLPWCGDSREVERTNNEVLASVTIDFKGIRKTFTTKNLLKPYQRIDLTLVDGPFSELSGSWEFQELGLDSCKVVLHLDFDFSNKLVGALVGPVFSSIADSMVGSFCSRADEVDELHSG
jgi:ribosome-associated toxin RatA of RatAB toxin-antitoxin module